MSWADAFAAEREAAARAPKAANPATFGEIWSTSWQAAGLDTAFGVGEPWAEAQSELRAQVETVSGMSAAELARAQGKRLAALDWTGATEEAKAKELADLAGGLSAEQQEKLKPYLDVPGRARAKAAERERRAQDVADRTFGLSGHAVGFLSGMTRQALDPINAGTMFVGGPLRGPVLKMLGREAALGAGIQAVQEPFIEAGRAELGVEAGFGRAVGNIFEAGLGNAGLAGLFRGGAWLLRQGLPRADGVPARLGEAAPAPAAESRLDGGARESFQESPAAAPGIGTPAAGRLSADLPPALRELAPEDLDAVARLAERDQLVDRLAPDQSSLGKSLHGEAVEAAIARLETAGGEALARFDRVLADLDRRLDAASEANAAFGRERDASGATVASPVGEAGPAAPPSGRTRRRLREPAPVSLGRFIAQQGGIRLDPDVRHMGIHQMFVPGVGMVGRVNGRQLDRDLEPMLIAAGYIPDHDRNLPSRDIRAEVFDALEQEFKMKRPRYAAADADALARREQEAAFKADQRLFEERLADEITAEAETIRTRLAEAGLPEGSVHEADIAEAAELVVRGVETSWEDALERVAIQRVMSDNPELPALAAIADDIPPGWEIDNEVSARTASGDRQGAGADGTDASGQADRGRSARAGEDLPRPGEAGAAAGGREGDPALASLAGLSAALPDPAGYRARLADLERALADDPSLVVALDSGDVPARKLIAEIAADAEAADALKACLGQKGGDA
jgi:hypothetical protein